MAEIPVERKSGMGWLWALLALVLIALIAWWLIAAGNDDEEVERVQDTEVVQPVDTQAMNGATTAAAGAGAGAGAMAIGDSVDLDNVRVTSLAGDMAFNIETNGQTMLVVFDQVPTPDTAKEGEIDVNKGSIVNITGDVRAPDATLPASVKANIPADADRFIYATNVEVVG